MGTLEVLSKVALLGSPTDPITAVSAIRDDGSIMRFSASGSGFTSPPGTSYRLRATGGGYTLTDADDTVEVYNGSGVLQSVTTRSGRVQTLTCDSSQRLSTITDSFGNRLTLGYDGQSRLISVNLLSGPAPASCLLYSYSYSGCNNPAPSATSAMTGLYACIASQLCGNSYLTLSSINSDPAVAGQRFTFTESWTQSPGCGSSGTASDSGPISSGSGSQCTGSTAVQYGYDGKNRLRVVWYADAAQRTFLYESSVYPDLFTGVLDESHNRLATWSFDNQKRAVGIQQAGGANGATLTYNSPLVRRRTRTIPQVIYTLRPMLEAPRRPTRTMHSTG